MGWLFDNDPIFTWNNKAYDPYPALTTFEEAVEKLKQAKWKTQLPIHPGPEPLSCIKPILPKKPQARMYRVQARG